MRMRSLLKLLAVMMVLILPVFVMWLVPKPEASVLATVVAPGLWSMPDEGLMMLPVAGLTINLQNIQAMYKSFVTIFNEAFLGVETLYQRIAMVVPSSTKENAYPWLGAFPKMREWIGERQIQNLMLHDYTLKNKKWELSFAVLRDDVDDDNIGVFNPVVSEGGRGAAAHPDELTFETLAGGFSNLCYDGQNFFDTDHPVGDGTVSNFGGGAGAPWVLIDDSRAIKPIIFQARREVEFISKDSITDDNVFKLEEYQYGASRRDNAGYGLWQLAYGSKDTLDAANYSAARTAMIALKDDKGKPLGIKPTLLVCGPSNEGAARELLLSERTDAGGTNKWRGTAELLVVPWLD